MKPTSLATVVIRFFGLYVILKGLAAISSLPLVKHTLEKEMGRIPLPFGIPSQSVQFHGTVMGVTYPANSLNDILWTNGLVGLGVIIVGVILLMASGRIGELVAGGLE